jgi:hypothetical protein
MARRPVEQRTPEYRANMRAQEKSYLDKHPDKREAKREALRRRYSEDPEVRIRNAERGRLWREKKRLAAIQIPCE